MEFVTSSTYILVYLTFVFANTNGAALPVPCGQRRLLTSRVIGGHDAGPWPWQARIKNNASGKFAHWCGGSLINDEWIVTAAHCVFKFPDKANYQIILGDYSDSKKEPSEQVFEVFDIRHHHNFSTNVDIGNDIALMRLSRKVTYTSAVQPICLPKQNHRIAVGSVCTITGWGVTDYSSRNLAQVLQEASIPIVSNAVCNATMHTLRDIDDKSMICAGYGNTSTISGCNHDSGGPMSCKENGVYVLRGAVSFGDIYCSTKGNQRSVFARISTYVDWIHQQITSPPPVYPDCKDNHWFCSQWKTNKCLLKWYQPMLFKYCPITCGDPKCKT